jgi:glycyl-tRNA synthetase alpha chain
MDTFQQTIFKLKQFWAKHGCVIQEPYDMEVGAGTMCPETFLRVLGPKPYSVAYVQPSRRPADGRYGENPNRLYKHSQLQVILKPAPANVMDLYLESLEAIGINLSQHDLKFEEDNWESPTLGAWGIGWQVMLDGLEVTQFTYFQQCGGVDLDLVPSELTYGLERLIAFLQDRKSVYDIEWVEGRNYGDVRLVEEQQFSVYNFEKADVKMLWTLLDLHEAESQRLIDEFKESHEKLVGLVELPKDLEHRATVVALLDRDQLRDVLRFPLLAAYDHVLNCSHTFNLLDARGAISVTERVGVIGRVRKLAVGVATAWMEQQALLNAAPVEVAQ